VRTGPTDSPAQNDRIAYSGQVVAYLRVTATVIALAPAAALGIGARFDLPAFSSQESRSSMRQRSMRKFRPVLDRFEAKQLLSAGSSTAHATHAMGAADHAEPAAHGDHHASGFLLFRVTNTPYQTPYDLVPPFQQVLVQGKQPVPGQVYNVCDVAVKNGTAQTFTASDDLTVRMTNQPRSFAGFPILTGNEQWKPGQVLVFYVLTKKYYPVSFVAGGFQFNLKGRSSTAIPGPSGIFLRLKYNPPTFARTLNWIVAYGQGNEVGKGASLGLPNTSINELVSGRTHRADFAGHF
jgi:hypothetical protein